MKIVKKIFSPNFALFWMMAAALILFSILEPAFMSYSNLMNVLKNASYMAIMVLGVTWCVAIGETDVSFPDIAACSSMVFAYLAVSGTGLVVSIIGAVVAGTLCGVLSSVLIVRFKYNALITTIGVSVIAKSIAAALNGGMPLSAPVIKSTGLYAFINGDIAGYSLIWGELAALAAASIAGGLVV